MPLTAALLEPSPLSGLPASLAPAGAADADRALANLAQVLAHRLRSPLATIQGYTDLLLDTLATEDQRDLALRVFEAAATIERMLADLQRFSLECRPVATPLNLKDIIVELLLLIGEEVEAVDHVFDDELNDAFVYADPVLLRQALLVLLQNAVEAGRPVRIRLKSAPEGVQVEVWNEGAMSAEVAAHALEPFFTTKAQNLGLGLPIARRIVEAHGGQLRLLAAAEATGLALVLPSGPA